MSRRSIKASAPIEPSVFPSHWTLPKSKGVRPMVHADHTVDTVLAPVPRFSFSVQANAHRRYQDAQRLTGKAPRYVVTLTDGTREEYSSIGAASKAYVVAGARAVSLLQLTVDRLKVQHETVIA